MDVHIITDPYISVSEGHYIGEKLRRSVMRRFSDIVDVVVHIDPEDDTYLHDKDSKLPNRLCIDKILKDSITERDFSFVIHYVNEQLVIEILLQFSMTKTDSRKMLKKLKDDFLSQGFDVKIELYAISNVADFIEGIENKDNSVK